MSMSDPIADYLTRVRNAIMANKKWVDIPSSSFKIRISYVLKEENFVKRLKWSFVLALGIILIIFSN